MKRMYPTTPIITAHNNHKAIASMNTGRLLRNAYLTSRDEYPSSLLPYNPGLGDVWVSSIHQHDYAMQFISGKVLPYVVSPIAKVNYWDGNLKTDILPYHYVDWWDEYGYRDSRLSIPASVYILAVLSISSLRKYVKDKDDLLKTTIIKEIVATVVGRGEAEYYAVGFYQYTGFYKELDICDIYLPNFWPFYFQFSDGYNTALRDSVYKLLKLCDDLSPLIFDLVIKANARYPIKKLESKYGKEYYYKSSEFINKLSDDVKFHIKYKGGSYYSMDRINKYFMRPEIFKIRIKYPEEVEK